MASPSGKRDAGPKAPGDLEFDALAARKRWAPLPELVLLAGESAFLRKHIERRIIRELFGDTPPSIAAVARFDAAQEGAGLLSRVLDELRTVSILSSERLVIVDGADGFLSEHRDDLEPFVESGFAGGHLVLHLDRADGKTRFVKAVLEKGWVVRCRQPFDRPPPWKPQAPPWENPLAAWTVAWAAAKGLEIDARTAHLIQERVGSDLGAIDESLEKIRVWLGDAGRRVDRKAVEAVTGEIRDDSVFDLVECFLARDRARALDVAERLFRSGYHPAQGAAVLDPTAIAILFAGALVKTLKPLRRAHALAAEGAGPERWLELGLTSRPFIDRFRANVRAMPPERIDAAFRALHALDRGIKTGADARIGLTLFLARE